MAEALNDSIEKLRKESQTLLARVDEDSKKANAEVKRLHLQTSSLRNYDHKGLQSDYVGRNTDLRKLRNDSSEISAILCPDHFHSNLARATTSVPDMMSSGKLMLTCNKPKEQRTGIFSRKPVKDCYCYSEANKVRLRPSKTRHKLPSTCCRCKSQFDLRSNREEDDELAFNSPVSCETFRRVQKIDYAPKSQFLRNVRSKICSQNAGQGDYLRTCPRSPNYHEFMSSAKMQDTVPHGKTTLLDEDKLVEEKQQSPLLLTAPANSLASEKSEHDVNNVVRTPSKGIEISSQKHSKTALRKTITSKRQTSESNERAVQKSPFRSKRTTPLRKEDCPCYYRNETGKTTKFIADKEKRDYYKRRGRCLNTMKYHEVPIANDPLDQDIEDLKKFREQNYFDTHGSGHTVVSSRSSGSLQQYLLNERLFPEPVGRIHKQDLVVTTPPCATVQKKRIHYFPRYVVQQERNACYTNHRRKKRYQSCPLTGHAIDLGILKVRPPLNSLALKYQKRAP